MKTGSQEAEQIKTSLRKSAVSDVTSVVTIKRSIKKQNFLTWFNFFEESIVHVILISAYCICKENLLKEKNKHID